MMRRCVALNGKAAAAKAAKTPKPAPRGPVESPRLKLKLPSAAGVRLAGAAVTRPTPAAAPSAGGSTPVTSSATATTQRAADLTIAQLTEGQRKAVQAMRLGKHTLLTGQAGSGKTVTLKAALQFMDAKKTAVTASTGVAAVNVGGTTLHSFMRMSPALANQGSSIRNNTSYMMGLTKSLDPTQVRTIVIDEISMVTPSLFTTVDHACRAARGVPGVPFGGIQVIACGDFMQLPPVAAGTAAVHSTTEGKSAKHVFELPIFKYFNTVYLSGSQRQKDPIFTAFLNKVREGEGDRAILSKLASKTPHPDAVRLRPTNREVDEINAVEFAKLPGQRFSWRACVLGHAAEAAERRAAEKAAKNKGKGGSAKAAVGKGNKADGKERPRDVLSDTVGHEVELAEGARVMLLKNLDVKGGLVNGATGRIVGFTKPDYDAEQLDIDIFRKKAAQVVSDSGVPSPADLQDAVLPIVDFGGSVGEHVIGRSVWEMTERGSLTAVGYQIPLRKSWACTVHKSQGATIEKLDVDLGTSFEKATAYVALSRATSMEHLSARNVCDQSLQPCNRALAFYRALPKF